MREWKEEVHIAVTCLFAIFAFVMFLTELERSNLLDECEATLPRDQHCVLVAVPEAE